VPETGLEPDPDLGVVIVTFNSSDVILDCLESLLAAPDVRLSIVVVDNASTDGTPELLRAWAAGRIAFSPAADLPVPLAAQPKPVSLQAGPAVSAGRHQVSLIETGTNLGFAGGVNRGLAALAALPTPDRFWVLNPDSVVPPETPGRFARAPGAFALMGGRVVYLETPDRIQIDGGTIAWMTGVTGNINLGAPHPATADPAATRLDFVTGASLVVSRSFYQTAGPMAEDYFLYYEEVDWAMRRRDLPLAFCAGAVVFHRGGTAIGSPTIGRPASAFSLYFKHRARMMFLRRHAPWSMPTGLAYSLAKALQLLFRGYPREAWTILGASLGLPPVASVRGRLSPEAQERAFGRRRPRA
jgi:hypothetical protein